MNSTANAIDHLMSSFRDHTLILEEWNMFALQSRGQAGQQAASMAFSLANGVSKRRLNRAPTDRARLVWLTSSNRPFPNLISGLPRDTANAAMDRMITLTIGADREWGVFDDPAGVDQTAGRFAAGLIKAAHEQHGSAMVEYLRQLTAAYTDYPAELRSYIRKHQSRFTTKVMGLAPVSAHLRVTEAFGLVHAAGELAKRFGVLPSSYNCFKSTRTAYKLHLASRAAIASPVDRLLALLDSPDLLDLRSSDSRDVTKEMIDAASGVRWASQDEDGELLLTADQLQRLTPDRPGFLKDSAIRASMLVDKNRRVTRRYTHEKGGRGWYYCFQIVLLRESGHL